MGNSGQEIIIVIFYLITTKETLKKSVYSHAKGPVELFFKETGLEAEHKAPKLTLCCGKLMRFPEKRRNTPLPGSSQTAAAAC